MTPLSYFFPHVLPYLPTCSNPLAAQVVRDSAIAFCEQTDFVREDLDPLTTVAGLSTYELDVPTHQQVARVLRVRVAGRDLKPLPADNVHSMAPRNGEPVYYHTTRNASTLELQLYPTPDKAYPLAATASLRPTRTAPGLEDDLFDLWIEPIVAGAIARAMRVPGQAFTDQAGAQGFMAQAQAGINRARREGAFGRLRGSLSVKARPFS